MPDPITRVVGSILLLNATVRYLLAFSSLSHRYNKYVNSHPAPQHTKPKK